MTNRIILDGRIVDDAWQIVEAGAALPPTGDIVVSLASWQEQRALLAARDARTGVWLKPDDEPRLLRQRYGFGGELRAVE